MERSRDRDGKVKSVERSRDRDGECKGQETEMVSVKVKRPGR